MFYIHWSDYVMSYEIKGYPQDDMASSYPSHEDAVREAEISLDEWGTNDVEETS